MNYLEDAMEPCICDKLNVLMEFFILMSKDLEFEESYDLKYVEAKTLMLIRRFPNQPMSFYSKNVFLENSSFSYVASKLEKKGYIIFEYNEVDKRSKMLILSEEGAKIALHCEEKITAHLNHQLQALNEANMDRLYEALDSIKEINQLLANR